MTETITQFLWLNWLLIAIPLLWLLGVGVVKEGWFAERGWDDQDAFFHSILWPLFTPFLAVAGIVWCGIALTRRIRAARHGVRGAGGYTAVPTARIHKGNVDG